MPYVTCTSCGETVQVPRRAASIRCRKCRSWIEMAHWRRLWAVQDLEGRVRGDQDLPDDLRAELVDTLVRRTEALRKTLPAEPEHEPEVTFAPSAPEAIRPPPLPPPIPKPPPTPLPVKPRPKKRPKKRARRKGPSVWERLGPAFAENVGFGLAAFLIVAGAVYFTTTAWTTMTGEQRLLVVVGGLVLLGGVLYAAARLLNRSGNLPEVERVLLLVVVFLVPVAAIPAGNLLLLSVWRGLLAALLVFGLGLVATRRLARVLDPVLTRFLPAAFLGLSVLVLFGGPLGERAPILAAVAAAALLLASTVVYARGVLPKMATSGSAFRTLWPVLLPSFAACVFAGRVAIGAVGTHPSGVVFATLGIVVSAFGAVLVTLEPALVARRRPVVLLVVAMALGLAGTVMAFGDGVGLLAASALGAYACLRAGLALPVPWFAVPGLLLAALAYLKSPAPIHKIALALRDSAADALGYSESNPLPLAWYGLTFLPYVAACGLTGWILHRRGHDDKARVFLLWAFASAIGLAVMSVLASGTPMFSDLRAAAAVLGAQGALLVALGMALRQRWFVLAGTLGLYGGAACAAVHFEATPAILVFGLSLFGLVGFAAATFLSRAPRIASDAAKAGILDATAVLAGVLVSVAVLDGLQLLPAPWWHGFGYLALAALLALLGFSYRRPEVVPLASLALAAAGARFVVGAAPDAGGDIHLLVLSAVSALPLLAPKIDPLLPDAIRHPTPPAPRPLGTWTPVGALLIQLVGLALFFARLPDPGWTLPLAGGLLLGASVLAIAATRETQPWPLYVAVLELGAAGIAAGNALQEGPPFATPAFVGASAALVLICLPLWLKRPRALVGPLAPPLRHLLPTLTLPLVLWAAVLVLGWLTGEKHLLDGLPFAASGLAVAASLRLALLATPTSTSLQSAAAIAGFLFAPIAAGLLTVFDPAPHAWPLAFIGAAVATVLWAGGKRVLQAPAGLHLLLALGAAVGIGVEGLGDPWWLLVAFLLLAAAGRVIAIRRPVPGWTFLLVSLLLGLAIALFDRILEIDLTLQPAVWLGFAALVLLACRVPFLRVSRVAAHLVTGPILALGGVTLAYHAVHVALLQPTTDLPEFPGPLANARYDTLAFVIAAGIGAFVLPLKPAMRRVLPALALGLASFVLAPLNLWLAGADTHFWRPDMEVGVLAFALALLLPYATRERPGGRLGEDLLWPLLFGVVAIGLTVAAFRDPSTPLTVLAVLLTAATLLLRDRREHLAHFAGGMSLATALAFAAWWSPMPGSVQEGMLLLYGAVSALVAPILAMTARFLSLRRAAWKRRAGREFYEVAIVCAALAFLFVAADILSNLDTKATTLQIVLAAIALGIPGLAAAWGALKEDRPHLIHVALVAFLLFYVFLVQRTDHLAFLDGYHLHAFVVLGAGLLFASEFHPGLLGRLLAIDGLLLAAPAVFFYAPAAFGLWGDYGPASSALALASICCAAGARRLGSAVLGGVAAALINLVLFAFWRRHGFVDPAFYGIPPGLSLLGAAAILGNRITKPARLALVVPGLALLYGSVAIQVVRADDPLHALLLFGLGFLTVVLGFRFRKNAWLVTGMVVIVLDVVVYLASHGFQSGFFGAALLVAAGLAIMAVAALATFRRRKDTEKPAS